MSHRVYRSCTACLALALALCACSGGPETTTSSFDSAQNRPIDSAQGRPRLVVLIVVDQMRADYLDRLRPHATGGFKRLLDEGAWFSNAAFPYHGTYTCPGHATIATGTMPATHGVPDNEWYDRVTRRVVACAEDANARPVRYDEGGTGGLGSSAHNLRVETLAGALRRQRGARVVSLALKARSAIMLAGPQADAVTWLSGDLEGWETSSAYSDTPLPAVQAFVDANPIDADRGRIWMRLLPDAAYSGADAAAGEWPPPGWSTTFPHVLDAADPASDTFGLQWERSPYADAYIGRFAAALAESFTLGTGDRTDVLAVGFSSPDLLGHRYGPQSHEVQDVFLQLDFTLGRLLERLDALVGRGEYVVALTSDHGVAELPEQLQAEGRPGGRLPVSSIAAIAERAAREAAGDGTYVARVTGNDVYFEPGMSEKLNATGALERVIAALRETPGIARAFEASQLQGAQAAEDEALREAALSYVPGVSGDVVLQTEPGFWVMSSRLATTHGTGHDYDQRVPIVLMGPGLRPGRYDEAATPADIAPTLAALIGVSLSQSDGRVLTDAIAAAAPAAR